MNVYELNVIFSHVPGKRRAEAMAAIPRSFSSVREEMEFYKARFEETQAEFEEFQQGSRVREFSGIFC